MQKLFIFLPLLFLFFLSAKNTSAAGFFYPITHTQERITLKPYGTFVDAAFYKNKEDLFKSARPQGYHTGADFEILEGEQNKPIPVYAVGDGKILYAGDVNGYGGVILLSLKNNSQTAIYGHIKTTGISIKKGDTISAGTVLTYLGNAFSDETGEERKHLHFGIYNGTDIYFTGHEKTKENLLKKWVDPIQFLRENNAQEPGSMTNEEFKMKDTSVIAEPVTQTKSKQIMPEEELGPLKKIIRWIQNLFV